MFPSLVTFRCGKSKQLIRIIRLSARCGKPGGDNGIAERDVREKQKMHDREENEGTLEGGKEVVITSFRTCEGAGPARKKVQEPKVATASTENQRHGEDEGKSSDAHPRPHPARETWVLRRRRGG
jgi:hypothetical protein